MKLAAKIWLLLILTWSVGMSASCFLLYRIDAVSTRYDQLFDRDLRLQDSARQMQVTFKKQVQEWKDILLRGSNPEALKKYSEAFHKQEKAVDGMAEAFVREAADPQVRSLAEQFAQAHKAMSAKYAAALTVFVQGQGVNLRDADAMVKGQDRAPTTLID